MKKQLILLSTALLFSVVGFSQLTFGPAAGLTYSILSTSYENADDEPDDNSPASGVGFHLGGVANIAITDNIGVQPGLIFESRSATDSFDFEFTFLGETTKTEVTAKSSYSYLNIPILLTYGVGETITIFLGPQIGILAGAKHKVESTTTVGGETTTTNEETSGSAATEGMSSTDVGVAVGGQVNLQNNLTVGAKYIHGLTPINEEGQDFAKSTWGTIQVTLGFLLGS